MSVDKLKSCEGSSKYRSLENVDWSFRTADTKSHSHGLHWYPARMIPQIPQNIFKVFLKEGIIRPGDTVFDPFGGSGTTGVEANLANLNARLVDLNPLACMIARGKTTPLDMGSLLDAYRDFLVGELPGINQTLADQFTYITTEFELNSVDDLTQPEVNPNYDWFPEPQLYQLGHLSDRLTALESKYGEDITRYFRLCVSSAAREVSYQRNKEFKRYRIPKKQREAHNPDVLVEFQANIHNKVQYLTGLQEALGDSVSTVVHCGDARCPPLNKSFKADAVLTSPPYGDHPTTVTYGEFSIDQAVIAKQESRDRMKAVDKEGLGGLNSPIEPMVALRDKSPTLDRTLDKLAAKDGRSEDALTFFQDYYEVIKQIKHYLKHGQPAVIVVANRSMSRTVIPTHQITIDLFRYLDFDLEVDLERSLPSKILPTKNAPENESGNTGDTMTNEHILIFEKR